MSKRGTKIKYVSDTDDEDTPLSKRVSNKVIRFIILYQWMCSSIIHVIYSTLFFLQQYVGDLILELEEEKKKLAAERKEFHETKYSFLLENAALPEWKEDELKKLLLFDSLVEANVHLNMLLANNCTFSIKNKKKKKILNIVILFYFICLL